MSDAVITGRVTFPMTPGGSTVNLTLGAPLINASSAAGPTEAYEEGGTGTMKVVPGAPVAVAMGSVASANVVYIGSDQPLTLVLNGGADDITITAGGFVLLAGSAITSMTVEATLLDAEVTVLVLGD